MARPAGNLFRKLLPSTLVALTILSAIIIGEPGAYASTSDGLRIYQNAQKLTDEHKEAIAKDIERYRSAENLWDQLRDEFSLPHYENNPLVKDKIEWYMNNQEFLLRAATRAAPYLYFILQQVRKQHLPAELVLLPIVESGYNPFAISSAGAAGIWQMMPNTASGLGLRQDGWYDGRRDVVASTNAALNYLAYLQSFFDGNWLLAIAAYNTGEGNVLAAIRKNIRDGRSTDFWSLPVAHQTKNYVPSFLALCVIISQPDKYPVYLPPVRNAPYLAQLTVGSKISLKYAARLAGIKFKTMKALNPGFNRPAARGPYRIILPIENVEQFSDKLSHSPYRNKNAHEWVHYQVQSGDTLYRIARKFKTTTTALRKLNHLSRNRPRRGTTLIIPVTEKTRLYALKNASSKNNKQYVRSKRRKAASRRTYKRILARERKKYNLHPGDTLYVVRKNDTIIGIAKRYKISPKKLMAANNVKGVLRINDKLVIPSRQAIRSNSKQLKRAIKPGETLYVVRRGDTINKIAKRFKTKASSIRHTNKVSDKNLMAGAKLIIPSSTSA